MKRPPIDNSFSIKARYEKAQKLSRIINHPDVRALLPENFKPAMVMQFTDEQWALLADLATAQYGPCKPPNSEATKLTIKLILERGF